MSDTPVKRIKIGLISATIWANESDKGAPRYSITIVRNYLKDESWNETSSFGVSDLPIVSKIADLALAEVLALQSE